VKFYCLDENGNWQYKKGVSTKHTFFISIVKGVVWRNNLPYTRRPSWSKKLPDDYRGQVKVERGVLVGYQRTPRPSQE